jgi:hypothetical protein
MARLSSEADGARGLNLLKPSFQGLSPKENSTADAHCGKFWNPADFSVNDIAEMGA